MEKLTHRTRIARLKRWIAALRSGKYKRCTKKLHDASRNRYCCLGVAADISKLRTDEIFDSYTGIDYYLGLEDHEDGPSDRKKLTKINDSDHGSFEKAARWIEENLVTRKG